MVVDLIRLSHAKKVTYQSCVGKIYFWILHYSFIIILMIWPYSIDNKTGFKNRNPLFYRIV